MQQYFSWASMPNLQINIFGAINCPLLLVFSTYFALLVWENKVQAINFQDIAKNVIPNLFRDLSDELGKELLFSEQENLKPLFASLSDRC